MAELRQIGRGFKCIFEIIFQKLQVLTAILLPPRCPVTGGIVERPGLMSAEAWAKVVFVARPFCPQCGIQFEIPLEEDTVCPACQVSPPPFDRVRSVFAYDEHSRDMILAFKHGDQTHLAASFVPWLARAGEELRDGTDIIVPVPLHRKRLLKRRYNQAALLSGGLARVWRVRHMPHLLLRVKHTDSQGHLTHAQRHDNVAGAFSLRPGVDIRGKHIVLVDDVYTSGATVSACAKVLKKAGAVRVDVLVLARVMKERYLDLD